MSRLRLLLTGMTLAILLPAVGRTQSPRAIAVPGSNRSRKPSC